MDMKRMKAKQNAAKNGVPDCYADRDVMEAHKIRKDFVNDAPVIIIRKPKNAKNKETGKYERVYSKNGHPIFNMVAYMPIDIDGQKAVVVTASEENVGILRTLIDDVEPKLIRGENIEDIDRWEQYTAEEVIEGKLRFVLKPKKYHNNEVYDVAVLESADD